MSIQPGGYVRTFVGYEPMTGRPMFRDEPGPGWRDVAATWPVTVVSRETEPGHLLGNVAQLQLACGICDEHPSVFCLSPNLAASAYTMTCADLLAGILAHIRRSHPDVVASS